MTKTFSKNAEIMGESCHAFLNPHIFQTSGPNKSNDGLKEWYENSLLIYIIINLISDNQNTHNQ